MVLVAVLTAITTGGLVHFLGQKPGHQWAVQEGVFIPEGRAMGTVYFVSPYTTTPQLTLTPPARYSILAQDPWGFTWVDRALLADLPSAVSNKLKGSQAMLKGPQPALNWKSEGMPAGSGTPMPLVQKGTFTTVLGESGKVFFPHPFKSPPNITLTGKNGSTIVADVTKEGFQWKNSKSEQTERFFNEGDVTWKAAGLR